MANYYAKPCPCGYPRCNNWLVEPVAAYQGVSFTERQAKAVAGLLNFMEETPASLRIGAVAAEQQSDIKVVGLTMLENLE